MLRGARRLTILFIPLESEGRGLVHRGANMARMLRQQHNVIGLVREPSFGNGPSRYLRLLGYWAANFRLGFRHRREIDAIFAENIHAFAGGILGKIIQRPCIWDTEGDDHVWAKAWERRGLVTWLTLTLQSLAGRLSGLLIVPCEEDRQAYVRRGYTEGRVVTFPLCLDFSLLPDPDVVDRAALRRRLGLDPLKTVLLYSGNRSERPYYRVAEWICGKMVPELTALCGDRFVMMLTGAGPKLRAPEQVVFTGFVNNFTDYLMAADICLFPVWFDMGTAGKVVEYMSAGKPTVTTRLIRGFPELRDGVNAVLAGSEAEFVAKIRNLMENPSLGTEIGARSRETAMRWRSSCDWAAALAKIVRSVVEHSVATSVEGAVKG